MNFEDVIGYSFKNKKLLEEALTHKSYSTEQNNRSSNERLEFLGDSVLGLVVCFFLFRKFPQKDEGFLSKLKSHLVSRKNLTLWAKKIRLGSFVYLGEGEILSGGRKKDSILANALEALIGAIYLDAGFQETYKFIANWLRSQDLKVLFCDYKSSLQEIIQKKYKKPPVYVLVSSEGPEHKKIFTVKVKIKNRILGSGSGASKKEAEQNAAKKALKYFLYREIKNDT